MTQAATIKAARESAGISVVQAAALVHVTPRAWQRWESGDRQMHPAIWELFMIKIGEKHEH